MAQTAQHIRFCTSRDGTRIAYAVCGQGPPLLWIGHWVRHVQFDWDSPVWRPWLQFLTQRHTVVRYDWRGCGLSDRDGVTFSFDRHLEDCEAVMAAAGLRRFGVLATSGGGTMAVAYAARHASRVSRLVLYGAQTRGLLVRGMTAQQREMAETRLKVIELGWPDQNPAYGQFFTRLHMPDAPAEHLRAYNELLRATTTPGNTKNLLRSYWNADVRADAPRVACPTLVLHATQDAIMPFEEGRAVASLIPKARFVPLESRNHILLDSDAAWPAFTREVQAFLAEDTDAGREDAERADAALPLDELTARERQVFEIMAEGLDNTSIARRLGISEKTVRNHVSNIFDKLGVASRAQAIVRAHDARRR